MLTEAATYSGSPVVLFLDGFDGMDPAHLPHNLYWLPETSIKVALHWIFVLTSPLLETFIYLIGKVYVDMCVQAFPDCNFVLFDNLP